MKYIHKFDSSTDAIAYGEVVTPQIAKVGNLLLSSKNIESGSTAVFGLDASGNIELREKYAIIESIEYDGSYTDAYAYFSSGLISEDITYGVDGILEDRDGETETDEIEFSNISGDYEYFSMFDNTWDSYYDPTITYNGWYQEPGGEKIITATCSFRPDVPCVKAGTRVNLANGTYKNIEDITYNDDILVWDFDNGTYTSAKPCWITVAETFNYYYKCTLSNGTIINVIGTNGNTHRVYSVTDKSFIYINSLVGKQIYVKDAVEPVTVVSVEKIDEQCIYYNMDTAYHINWFAENVLLGRGLENMYEFSNNMTYIKDGREPKPYSIYEAVGISKYWYDNLRLSETTKTVDYMKTSIERMERTMKPRN